MGNMNLYEFIGVIIGDGYMRYRPDQRVYQIEIAGNVDEDYVYFLKIAAFIQKLTGKKPTIREKIETNGRSLRLEISNKEFIKKLIEMGLPTGKKTFTISIPLNLTGWEYSKHILRGIFETDGCIYFSKSKKGKYPTYPRIEIKTSSNRLLSQIISLLKERGFRTYCKKSNKTHSITISGEEMLQKWIKEIGFSNERNISKYNFWKKKGFYIPKISLKDRLECGGGPVATAVDF